MNKIQQVNIVDQIKEDEIRYSIYNNRKRAIPSSKDGLKTGGRRIVYGAYDIEKCIDRAVKSSALVGTIMKYLHPHGDAGIYGAMKTLENWWSTPLPLLKGEGNWGNFQGDTAAAARYTEVKISPFAVECVISEMAEVAEVVDWTETYDGRTKEPDFLPAALPLLLINGCFGIGLGMMTKVPKHNINEVIQAVIELIKNPNADIVLIPDQCMPCDILESDFKNISYTGNGSFIVRAKIDIVTSNKGDVKLVVRSTPDNVSIMKVESAIEALVEKKKLPQVTKMVDTSTSTEMQFNIELKKGSDPNYVKQVLYKSTQLENKVTVNFEALDGINPARMNYKSYLLDFIDFRKVTKFRYYCNLMQRTETKIHQKDAFIKVLESGYIDEIITMIRKRKSGTDEELIEFLIKKIGITDLQAEYIINASVKSLSIMHLNRYKDEAVKLNNEKKVYWDKIMREDLIVQEIIDELHYYAKKYGQPRMCKVVRGTGIDIPEGTFKLVITEKNFIKKLPENEPLGTLRNDNIKMVLRVENTENIVIFDAQGKVFKLPVHRIPISDKNSNGVDIRLIQNKITSNITDVIYEPYIKAMKDKKKSRYYVTVLTKGGNIKRMDLDDFLMVPPSGTTYCKVDGDDYVLKVQVVHETNDVVVYSKNKALRMKIDEVPYQKRTTKGMKASAEDIIDGMSVINSTTTDIVVITNSGKINRFNVTGLTVSGRNKAGKRVIALGKTDSIHGVYSVNDHDILRVKTKDNIMDIKITDIPQGSSLSGGTKMIPVKNGDMIIRCDVIHNG